MRYQTSLGDEVRLQRRLDRVEEDIGEEAVESGIRATRRGAEDEAVAGQQLRQGIEVGDAAGIGLLRLEPADALIVVAAEIVLPCRLQRTGGEARHGGQHGAAELWPE